MQVKEYIKQYKALKAEIATLQGEISEIMAMAEKKDGHTRANLID